MKLTVHYNTMLPDTSFGFVTLVYPWRGRGFPTEATFAWLRLPVYGMEYQPVYDDYRWSQMVLRFHGWHGFQLTWRDASNDTPGEGLYYCAVRAQRYCSTLLEAAGKVAGRWLDAVTRAIP